MVLRVSSVTGLPLSGVSDKSYNPLSRDAVRDPWIWRRVWMLSNGSQDTSDVIEEAFGQGPQTTAEYGSIQDGGHIDAKTARVIGPEERLCFCVGTKALPMLRIGFDIPSLIVGYADWRILASPRRASNRKNASR